MKKKHVVVGNENSGFKGLIFIPFTDSMKLTKAMNTNPWVPNCGLDFLPLLHMQNLDQKKHRVRVLHVCEVIGFQGSRPVACDGEREGQGEKEGGVEEGEGDLIKGHDT